MGPWQHGCEGNIPGSETESERRCTGWGASRDGIPSSLSCGNSAYDLRLDRRSRMRRESHVRFCEGAGGQFPRATRLVVLHKDRMVVERSQEAASQWLHEMGLELKPSKTRIAHTLEASGKKRGEDAGEDPDEKAGFDFLGFHIRQYPIGKTRSGKDRGGNLLGFKTLIRPSQKGIQKHVQKLRETIDSHRSAEQERLINSLNPQIVGWSNYYSTVASKRVFQKIGHVLFSMLLLAWAYFRHPNQNRHWIVRKYWRPTAGRKWIFRSLQSSISLREHSDTPIKRHVKVRGDRSPFDGDWVYWSTRRGHDPTVAPRVARLLKKQRGRCPECGMYFRDTDGMEIDHIKARRQGGKDECSNWQLLHRHCHHRKTARETAGGAHDKRQAVEEPDDGKPSRPVLKPSRGGDPPA